MLFLVGEPDGAERVDVADLFARQLAGRGLDVDYIFFTNEPSGFWQERQWHGARAFVVGRSAMAGIPGKMLNKLIEFATDLRTFWQAVTGSYEIIQVRDKFVVGVLGLLAARLSGKKFTCWLSYPYAECRILDGQEGRAKVPWLSILGGRVAKWLLYRVIMPNADHVFVQSQQMLEDVVDEGVSRELMTPVPMGVPESLLDVPVADPVANTVLYLGTLGRVRRLDILIHALQIVHASHPAARLIMVGDGPDPEDREFLEAVTHECGLTDFVEFTGMIPMHDAHDRVTQAAICVSPFFPTPILQSTSPTKISEYMALGRPVVANAHPEQSVIMAESMAGICVEWSAKQFAAAFVRLLDDPAAAEEMGARGRDYVRTHRIYPVIAPAVADQYRLLMQHGSSHDD